MVFQNETKAREEKAMNESIEIVGNLEAEIKKISSDIVDDRARFQTEIADIKGNFTVFQNESKAREEKAIDEFMSLAVECFKAMNVTFSPNWALGKQAWQSSDYGWNPGPRAGAEAAVDGNRASCMHTLEEATPWWMVNLATERSVARVVIVNRGDGSYPSWKRLRNVIVTVGSSRGEDGKVCGRFAGPGTKGQIIEINCTEKLRGRYVKLTMNSHNYLHVCEVEVYSF